MLASNCLKAQDYSAKVSSIDSIIYNLYDVISGDKNQSRDWDLFRYLFRPEAKLIPVRLSPDSLFKSRYLSVEEFIENAKAYTELNGFHEKEIFRTKERFNNICHIFSTYETYYSKKDKIPFAKGINSIQLLFDNERWWIVNIYWQAETADKRIPEKYLPID